MAQIKAGRRVGLHLRAVVLPEGIEQDLFVGGRFTFRPPARGRHGASSICRASRRVRRPISLPIRTIPAPIWMCSRGRR
jgi:hypothetical protein